MDYIEFDLEFVEQTPEAYLVSNSEIEEWIPKSQVVVRFSDEDLENGKVYIFSIPEWLAYNSGLI